MIVKLKQVKKPCAFEGCKNLSHTGGYCRRHYQQVILKLAPFKPKNKNIKPKNKNVKDPCDVEGCDQLAKCISYCNKHYMRFKRHGDPLINYARKHREKPINVMRSDTRYYFSNDDREYLSSVFKEQVGRNEGENVYSIE